MPKLELQADCRRCAALCCVATHFDASEDFALTKAAGEPCPHLDGIQHRCTIHAERLARGFTGCLAYDCHGAGQWVCAHLEDATKRQLAFMRLRPIFRALWILEGARARLGPRAAPEIDTEIRRLHELLEQPALPREAAVTHASAQALACVRAWAQRDGRLRR